MRGPLDYHRLRSFHAVARAGSIQAACRVLHLAQPTVSGQLHDLERQLGEALFTRVGRRLQLTDAGRFVLGYCDEIFALGDDLVDALAGRGTTRMATLHVGIVDALPKLIAHRLLEPALRLDGDLRVNCREDPPERLFAELAAMTVDVVLSDRPLDDRFHIKGHSHWLGSTGIGLFGRGASMRRLRQDFPASLNGQPLVIPGPASDVHRLLRSFLAEHDLHPRIAVSCEDNALLLAFGRAGAGLVPATLVLKDELKQMYGLDLIGELPGLREHFYAVTVERRIRHPAILALTAAARQSFDQSRLAPPSGKPQPTRPPPAR